MSDRIMFPKGTLIKIDAIPFELSVDTVVLGDSKNLQLIRNQRSLGVPSVLRVAQAEISDTIIPSSESINDKYRF